MSITLPPLPDAIPSALLDTVVPPSEDQRPYPQGKRFPLGLYSIDTQQQMQAERHSGWLIAHTYNNQEAHQAAVRHAGGWYGLAHLDARSETQTSTAIARLAARGPVAWWDFPEEMRYWEPAELETVKRLAAWTRAHDPQRRPNFMYIPSNYTAEDIVEYVPHLDVIGAGAYADFYSQPRAWVRWRVESEIEAIKAAGAKVGPDYLHGEKTPIGIVGCFHYADENPTSPITTAAAARHDFYSCLAAGARGILVFSYFHRADAPELQAAYDAYAKAAAELADPKGIGQALLFGQALPLAFSIASGPPRTPKFQPAEDASVQIDYPSLNVTARTLAGGTVVLAVNSSEQPITATIIGLPSTATSARLPFEARAVPVADGAIVDTFAALGVHVYVVP